VDCTVPRIATAHRAAGNYRPATGLIPDSSVLAVRESGQATRMRIVIKLLGRSSGRIPFVKTLYGGFRDFCSVVRCSELDALGQRGSADLQRCRAGPLGPRAPPPLPSDCVTVKTFPV